MVLHWAWLRTSDPCCLHATEMFASWLPIMTMTLHVYISKTQTARSSVHAYNIGGKTGKGEGG